MSQEVNDLIVGATLLGAYSGLCAAIFNHQAGDKLPLRKYMIGGAIVFGGLMTLGTGAMAATTAENPVVSVTKPVAPQP